jgi:hypothetical protein
MARTSVLLHHNSVQRLGEHVTAAAKLACACPWSVVLTQPRKSPESGDDLLPAWWRAWAGRESSHDRQGTCPRSREIP